MTRDDVANAIAAKVAGVFRVPVGEVSVAYIGVDKLEVTVSSDPDRDDVSFTYAQMAQLPEIFGTEHLNFSHDSGRSEGSSWTGSYGQFNCLTITARREGGWL